MRDKPVTPLRRRMLEDMALRKFGEKTQADYIRHVGSFARFLGRAGAVQAVPPVDAGETRRGT